MVLASRAVWARLLALHAAVNSANAFYIPGFSIRNYAQDEAIPLHVNKVYSDNTQLQYAYYDLPFVCPPTGDKHAGVASGRSVGLNLGEVLRGDRIMTSDYELAMGQDKECTYLCKRETDRKGVRRAQELIEEGYVAEWIVDNLPGATSFVSVDKSHKYYASGFKMGYKDISPITGNPRYFINNHLTLVIRWRKAPGRAGDRGGKVIVGFEVFTKSMEAGKRDRDGCPQDVHGDNDGMQLYLAPNSTTTENISSQSSYIPPSEKETAEDKQTLIIPYTYAVYFREDERVEWSKRWDMYFNNQDESTGIHWLAIVNSLVICSLLTAVVAMILARTVIPDGARRNKDGIEDGKIKLRAKKRSSRTGTKSPREKATFGLLDQAAASSSSSPTIRGDDNNNNDGSSSDEEYIDDTTGWKLLHGDVFRPPQHASLLAPLIGSGTQLVFTSVALLLLSTLGLLNPSFRGGFVSVGTGLYVSAGLLSGYVSARAHKTFFAGTTPHHRNTLLTALLLPGTLFTALFALNLLPWSQRSSTALPFSTLLALLALWLGIQLPLVHLGAWYAHTHAPPFDHPTKTSPHPRPIPPQPWYTASSPPRRALYPILLAGLIPFAIIFIELLFLFRALWQDKSGYYYLFGFLSLIAALHLLAVVEVAVVATYLQLCAENYHWWWQSVGIGAGSSLWCFAVCVWFYAVKLHIRGFVSGVLFFGYAGLACAVYGLLVGTVGFGTAYLFVRRIYGAIKAD